MTNLDQRSTHYGTPFGVLGTLGDLLKSSTSNGAELFNTYYSTSSVTARRIRRRNRLART